MWPIITPATAVALYVGLIFGMHLQAYLHRLGRSPIHWKLTFTRRRGLPAKRRGSRNRRRR